MAQTGTDFMTLPRHLFPHRMADALCGLVSQKHGTAKRMARAYGIDPSTAENLRKGHLSVPTLEKVAKAEGWALWVALGEEMFGQTYPDHLQDIIERTAHEQAARADERDSIRQMEVRAGELGALLSRPAA